MEGEDHNFIFDARFFDGERAKPHDVRITFEDLWLKIQLKDKILRWSYSDIRILKDYGHSDDATFFSTAHPNERLIVAHRYARRQMTVRALNLKKSDVKAKDYRKLASWVVIASLSISFILFVLIPSFSVQLTRFTPIEREIKFGNVIINQIDELFLDTHEGSYCLTPQGEAAIVKMTKRLMAEYPHEYPLNIRVYNSEMVNAFAVAGGHIVFFNGLIDAAESPEEVGAVLVHEIGHIVHRDSLHMMYRALGTGAILSLIIGDFSGAFAGLFIAEQLMQSSHSREIETAADSFAHERLTEAGLSTFAFAQFFERLHKEEDSDKEKGGFKVPSLLSTHPELTSRIFEARKANKITGEFDPILTDEEWRALRNMCSDTVNAVRRGVLVE